MNKPFSETYGIWRRDSNTEKRAEVYAKFMNLVHPSLDVGEKNYIGSLLRIEDNTLESDFNFEVKVPRGKYKTITCFEVIEHVVNPLNFLLNLKGFLDEGGVIYLSTPVIPFISWYQWNEHFTEYKTKQLEVLFECAGLEVVRRKIFRPFYWWFYFTGFKPLARLVMRNVLYELHAK